MSVLWSGRPYIPKTLVKAVIVFVLITLLSAILFFAIPVALLFAVVTYWVAVGLYVYWKMAHTYYVRESSVLITRDWVFGKYQREITFDKIQDVHVQQGLLARLFKCGSVVFVTTTGLEVGYAVGGGGRVVYGGVARPVLRRGAWNSFLDIRFPENVREAIMSRLIAWREAFQQQRIATAVERVAPPQAGVKTTSIADELAKLKELLDKGLITKEEYEAAKKKILGN